MVTKLIKCLNIGISLHCVQIVFTYVVYLSRSVCADVRPILRTVFRELDYLPPLISEEPAPETSGPGGDQALPTARWVRHIFF